MPACLGLKDTSYFYLHIPLEVAEDLRAWTGYWFGALEEGVSLVFDWENFMVLPSRISNPDRTEYPPESIWTTELKVSGSGPHSHHVSFGVHPEATAGFDPNLDIPLAPSGPYTSGRRSIAT